MENSVITLLLIAVVAYLLGSVSSAILVSKLFQLPDPSVEGSGNPGATNVLRLGGKLPAALTLFGDVAKGIVPVAIAKVYVDDSMAVSIATLMVFLGHLYPIYYRFQGGKGVATALGAYLVLSLPVFYGIAGVWISVALISRYSSVSSMTAMLAAPALAWHFLHDPWVTLVCGVIFVFVVIRHQANIRRLISGEENRINFNKG